MTKWCRLKTSQWHVLHSIRTDGSHEYLLTIDGEWFPTERVKWHWPHDGKRAAESTGPKLWEGDGFPKGGRVCNRCYTFVSMQRKTIQIDD